MMKDEKIVSLSGGPIPAVGAPIEAVVTMLESFLALAKQGELQGAVIAAIGTDRRTTYASFEGLAAWVLVGRMEAEKAKILEFLNQP
jgi:hypothetical protein